MISLLNTNCAGPKSTNSSNTTFNVDPVNNTSSVTTLPQSQIISNDVENNQRNLSSEKNKSLGKKHKDSEGQLKELVPAKNRNQKGTQKDRCCDYWFRLHWTMCGLNTSESRL